MIKQLIKVTSSLVLSTALVAMLPLGAIADSTTPATATTVVCPSVNGTTKPTGSSASTFTYNSKTCLWENTYYTWDPVTKVYTPKFSTAYTYNPADGQYEYTDWVYNTADGQYNPVVRVQPAPAASIPSASDNSGTTPDGGTASIANTGADSSNSVNGTNDNSATLNNNYDASMNNTVGQTAGTGNVSLIGNTTAGNAASGAADNVSNILNLLQSTTNLQPADGLVTFTANINGNVNGDLLLDPSQINTTGSGSNNSINSQNNNTLTVNNNASGLINNDINSNAASGSVNVSQNTTAGNATSGSANAVANIVNVLNSAIGAGKSFIGVININGNLNGDILLPPNFLDQLIASGAPSSNVKLSQQQSNTLNAELNNNQSITNNVNLAANSGNVNSSQNTTAGNATSGDATTNLTVFNLTGNQVVGANSLLVFVNVLGKWVGLIMDAPAGANSAALCGGSCQISSSTNNTADINSNSNNTINNNLNVGARSGDVTASQNTKVGNAASGDATASANIANFINDQFSLDGWFGMLFINVFGTWNGSFGINTDAGNLAISTTATNSSSVGGMGGGPKSNVGVFKFVPNGGVSQSQGNPFLAGAVAGSSDSGGQGGYAAIAAAAKAKQPTIKDSGSGSGLLVPLVGAVTFMAIMSLGSIAEYGGKARENLLVRKLNRQQAVQGQRKAWLRFTIF